MEILIKSRPRSVTSSMSLLLPALVALLAVGVASDRLTVPGNRIDQTLSLRESLAENYWPAALDSRYKHDLAASVCVGQSLLTRYSRQDWSMQMWDASGTSLVGRQAGAHQARGHQALCTAVQEPLRGSLYQELELLQGQTSRVSAALQQLHPVALNISAPAIAGRYCIVSIRSRLDASFFSTGSSELLATLSNHNTPNYATCVPNTCSEEVLQNWFQKLEGKNTFVNVKCTSRATVVSSDIDTNEMTFAIQPATAFSPEYHYLTNFSRSNNSADIFVTVDHNKISTGTMIFCLFLGVLVFTVLVATLLDYFHQHSTEDRRSSYSAAPTPAGQSTEANTQQHQLRNTPLNSDSTNVKLLIQTTPSVYGWEILQCFSIPQNWQRIFPEHQSANAIPVLDGLRCISMCWVIVVHRYMLMLVTSTHPNDLLKNRTNPNYWWLFNAYPSVDVFFVIAGFLLALTPFPRMSLKNVINMYVLRYLRLAPSVIVTVWGVSTAFAHAASGPVWDALYNGLFGMPCQKSWWSSMLLMPNVYDANDMCLGHLWSLSIDWQLSLLAILVFVPLCGKGSFLKRYLPLLVLSTISVIIPCVVSLVYALPPVPSVANLQKSLDFYNHYYVNTCCRGAPYCVGLLAGRLHLWLKDHPEALTKRVVRMGRTLSVAAVSVVLISPLQISSSNVPLSALHNTLAKPVFAAALAFLIIASCHGKGGVIGWLLSRPFIGRLARCSYCVYLTSLPVQAWASATHTTVPSEGIVQAYMCGGDLLFSIFSGVVLTLVVEMPFARILGNALKRNKSKASRKSNKVPEVVTDKLGETNLRETQPSDNKCPPNNNIIGADTVCNRSTESSLNENVAAPLLNVREGCSSDINDLRQRQTAA